MTPALPEKDETEDAACESENDIGLPSEVAFKHPLQNSWTLWYYRNDRTRTWEENLREVVTFETVEDFWAVYNHIELSSRLLSGCDYSVFKAGIKPMWEDSANVNGGRWLINLDKKQRVPALDTFWLEILMCLIGESFGDDGQIVNGAVVSVRNKGDKIGVWLGNGKMAASIMHVGQELKSRLGITQTGMLSFEAHEDTMHKAGSTAKSKFTV